MMKNLREILERHGIRQRAIARQVNIDEATLSLIISGGRQPTWIQKVLIVEALNYLRKGPQYRVEDFWSDNVGNESKSATGGHTGQPDAPRDESDGVSK